MPDIILPILHLNGTSYERLLEQLTDVRAAFETVYQAMKEAAPNGRDYYPQPGLMDKAEEQHLRRLKAVGAMAKEIDDEIQMLSDQHDGIVRGR